MPQFRITSPEGVTYMVTGPEGATEQQALEQLQQQLAAKTAPDPTENLNPISGMSTTERMLAGAGKSVMDLERGFRQRMTLRGVAPLQAASIQQEVDDARRLDQPLMDTRAGFAGNVAGNIAATIPTAFIPGANTYAGAGLVGAGLGALQPTAEGESPLLNAALGAGTGIAGQFLGKTIAGAVGRRLSTAEAQKALEQSQAAVRDKVIMQSRKAGFTIPPAMANPTTLNKAAEGFAGKISTAQAASVKNQALTDAAIKADLGIPDNMPLTEGALDSISKQAGKAYEAVKQIGRVPVDDEFFADVAKLSKAYNTVAAEFPDAVDSAVDSLLKSLQKESMGAEGAIEYVKKLRSDASGNFKLRDPAKTQLARMQSKAAEAIDKLIGRRLEAINQPELLNAYLQARQTIAKVKTARDVLNTSSGHVDPGKLARKLEKGVPLTGQARVAAEFAATFPKASQSVDKIGTVAGNSPLDWALGGTLGTMTGNPAMLASVASRPLVRGALLSGPGQAATTSPSYKTPLLTRVLAGLLGSPAVARLGMLGASPELANILLPQPEEQ